MLVSVEQNPKRKVLKFGCSSFNLSCFCLKDNKNTSINNPRLSLSPTYWNRTWYTDFALCSDGYNCFLQLVHYPSLLCLSWNQILLGCVPLLQLYCCSYDLHTAATSYHISAVCQKSWKSIWPYKFGVNQLRVKATTIHRVRVPQINDY